MSKTRTKFTLVIMILILVSPTVTCSKENILTPADSISIITNFKSQVNWQADCGEFLFADLSDNRRFFTYPIDENLYLLQVVCNYGAYQSGQIFYKIKNTSPPIVNILTFKQHIKNETSSENDKNSFITIKDTYLWGLISVNKSNNYLISENRYRSGGGCGTYTVFELDTTSPRIKEFRARLECTLSQSPPSLWKLYSSDIQDKWPSGKNPLRMTK